MITLFDRLLAIAEIKSWSQYYPQKKVIPLLHNPSAAVIEYWLCTSQPYNLAQPVSAKIVMKMIVDIAVILKWLTI